MALFNVLLSLKSLNIDIRLEGTGKEWVAMGTTIVISVHVLHLELLGYQSFNGFCCKLTEIALFIYFM